MKTIRARLIEFLDSTTPDIDAALALLDSAETDALSPNAASMRLALIDAANRLDAGDRPANVSAYLHNLAKATIDDVEDIEIDFDVPDTIPGNPFEGIAFPQHRNALSLPGPDAALLKAMQARDALTARKIAGDTIGADDIALFEAELIALGKALLPLLTLHMDDPQA